MSDKSGIPAPEEDSSLAAGIVARVGSITIALTLQMVILFAAAGGPAWTWAWVYLGINLAIVAIGGPIMLRTSPETVAERGRGLQGTQEWDKVIGAFYLLSFYFLLSLVAGLDARFDWTRPLGAAWHTGGAVVLAAGMGLAVWAMVANAYFSTAVRIQGDRGQTVCRSGPYRFVRHPGYVGFILQPLGSALLLGSLWALIPGLLAAALMVIRTLLEDRLLESELPGYEEYAQQVRYRLIPGLW